MLTGLQQRLLTVVDELPEAEGFALAGAGGLLVHGLIERPTRDLVLFAGPRQQPAVAVLADALQRRLEREGLVVSRRRDLPGFVRLDVTDPDGQVCEVDLATDFRARDPQRTELGWTLAVEELAANKVLAVFARAEARDFLDLAALTRRYPFLRLYEIAAEKDTGLDRERLIESLGAFRRFTAAEFGVDEQEYERLQAQVAGWQTQLRTELRRGREPPDRGLHR